MLWRLQTETGARQLGQDSSTGDNTNQFAVIHNRVHLWLARTEVLGKIHNGHLCRNRHRFPEHDVVNKWIALTVIAADQQGMDTVLLGDESDNMALVINNRKTGYVVVEQRLYHLGELRATADRLDVVPHDI